MWNIVTKPLDAVAEAKKEKNIGKSLLVLLVAVVLFGVSMFFFAKSVSGTMFLAALVTAIVLYILVLVSALVLKLILHVFTGKDDYFSALTPLAYCHLIFSFGLVIASILALIPSFVGPLLAFLVMLWALAISQGVLFKGTMEFYDVDVLTVLVAIVILYVSVAFAAYIAVAGQLITMVRNFGGGLIPSGLF